MNKLTITLLTLLTLSSCRMTKLNLKADKFSYREMSNNEWTQFTDWQPIDIKVKLKKAPFNIVKGKVIFYDKEKLCLKIIQENEESKTEREKELYLITVWIMMVQSVILF